MRKVITIKTAVKREREKRVREVEREPDRGNTGSTPNFNFFFVVGIYSLANSRTHYDVITVLFD